jgi:solute carrier family 25 carnitine/acylcarnitine transporter 20/29
MKSQIQGGYMAERKMSIYSRLKYTVNQKGGILALYRGILPGTIRSFIGNGSAMVAMQYFQKKVTEWGLRD